jgi:hypothetical protein
MKALALSIGRRSVVLIACETVLVVAAVCAGAFLRLGADAWDLLFVHGDISKALLIALVCQMCLYYADLYELRVVSDRRELFIGVVQALSATSFLLAAIYFWFPKMFGRMMDDNLGKIHFFLTFIFLNGTFYTMHILGAVGFPRRLADPYAYETFRHLQPMNQFMSICAILMVDSQVIFAYNFIRSMFFGTPVGRNPWGANSLEWFAPSPPGHGNFDMQPIVYRGPYEYGSPEVDTVNYPQTQPPPVGAPPSSRIKGPPIGRGRRTSGTKGRYRPGCYAAPLRVRCVWIRDESDVLA